MPLYEYACRACDHHFETLVRQGDTPSCPSCRSTELERRLSVFAAHTGPYTTKSQPSPGPCGQCGDPRGPGACSIN
jgi:putative FmdB family regulatory protein